MPKYLILFFSIFVYLLTKSIPGKAFTSGYIYFQGSSDFSPIEPIKTLINGYKSGQTSAGDHSHISNHQEKWVEGDYGDPAERIINLILETVGLQATFEVKKANVPNAAAVVYHGKRYILYNPSFISSMNKAAGTSWASVAILAHEIGHHLNGHTLDGKGSMPDLELEADEFSGFALRKMGANLAEAQLAMKIIANARATKTHPARNDRLLAIANGWNRADDQMNENAIAGKGIRPVEPGKTIVIDEEYIAYDVQFRFDPDSRYHVTVKNNLVKFFNNQLLVLGKLLITGKSSFPLAFQTSADDFLFVNNTGKIFNTKGKELGYLSPHK